ncbi:Membrane-associated guanylate kinase, WW and PDZ domain-containing protein 1 [Echinococcus granulosus]|nr:Membrane-associated guanylate kinase, WW and PDZ domain-containing protein 1 [Echinococcus granulosus]
MTPSSEQMQFYNNQFCHHQHQQLHQQEKERAVFFQVTLYHSSRGLGFSIRRCHEFNQMPFTISRVAEGGPAHLDGQLKVIAHTLWARVGDELLQINGFMTAGMSYRRAVEIIRAGGNLVRLGVRRSLLPTNEVKNFAALSPPPLPELSFARFLPLPPIPSSAPVVPQPPPAPPLPPPYLRSLQFFAPSSVHKSSTGSHLLLSSASAAAVASALPEWGNEDASGFPLLSTTFPPPVLRRESG